eukprot:264783_1
MSPSFLCATSSSPGLLKINIERTSNGGRSISLARTFLNWILMADLSHDYNAITNTSITKPRQGLLTGILSNVYSFGSILYNIWYNMNNYFHYKIRQIYCSNKK